MVSRVMDSGPKILVLGAGRRVRDHIAPALFGLGLTRSDITIVRRRADAGEGLLEGIPVKGWHALAPRYDLVLNCVCQHNLVEAQTRALRLFPGAMHFCDTPIFFKFIQLPATLRLAKHSNLYSLEDWPFMPNLQPIFGLCRKAADDYHLRFEHVGVPTHFFSVARAVAAISHHRRTRLAVRRGNVTTDLALGGKARCVLVKPKQDISAKISCWASGQLIEDFFELRSANEAVFHPEVVSRVLDGVRLRYFLGAQCLREVLIPAEVAARFHGRTDRRAAHDLDKIAGLMDVLGAALAGQPAAYAYSDSVRDAVAARFEARARFACEFPALYRGYHRSTMSYPQHVSEQNNGEPLADADRSTDGYGWGVE
jgi:hypothetical protein